MTSTVTALSLAFVVLFAVGAYFTPRAKAMRRINRWRAERLVVDVPNRRRS